MKDEEALDGALQEITSAWPEDRLGTDIKYLSAGDDGSPNTGLLRLGLIRRWAAVDPAAAAVWAESLPAGPERNQAIEQLALGWCSTDPDSAWDWAMHLRADSAREDALVSLAYELCRDEPLKALDRASSLADGVVRDQLFEHAIANLASHDPAAAYDRIRTISNPELREGALVSLTTSWSDSDPKAAATLAVDEIEAGASQERAVTAIVQRWAQQDSEAARDWVEAFPDGPLKEQALGQIATQSSDRTNPTKPR